MAWFSLICFGLVLLTVWFAFQTSSKGPGFWFKLVLNVWFAFQTNLNQTKPLIKALPNGLSQKLKFAPLTSSLALFLLHYFRKLPLWRFQVKNFRTQCSKKAQHEQKKHNAN